MKNILLTLLLFVPLSSYAEWKRLDSEIKNIESHEFAIPKSKPKKGFEIVALGSDPFQLVTFRYINGYVDYCVYILNSDTKDGAVICIDILDDDKYKICSHRLQKVASNFSGEIRGRFKCSWDEFYSYKYFNLYTMN